MGDQLRGNILAWPSHSDRRGPVRRPGDSGLNPGPDVNFFT